MHTRQARPVREVARQGISDGARSILQKARLEVQEKVSGAISTINLVKSYEIAVNLKAI